VYIYICARARVCVCVCVCVCMMVLWMIISTRSEFSLFASSLAYPITYPMRILYILYFIPYFSHLPLPRSSFFLFFGFLSQTRSRFSAYPTGHRTRNVQCFVYFSHRNSAWTHMIDRLGIPSLHPAARGPLLSKRYIRSNLSFLESRPTSNKAYKPVFIVDSHV